MKKPSLLLALTGLMLVFLTPTVAAERVRVTTNFGAFVIELQRDRAPLTVEIFLGYVRSGYYTNTLFHRTIANFVVQGGGVGPDYKAKPVGKPIANESGSGLKNLRGTVGLARAAGPHSGDCLATRSIMSLVRLVAARRTSGAWRGISEPRAAKGQPVSTGCAGER